MTAPLNDEDYQALAAFRYALRKFLRWSRAILAVRGRLTPEQYEVLLVLRSFSNQENLTVGELSERLQVEHHTAVSLINKLARRNLVAKKTRISDRRVVHLNLTPTGNRLIDELAKIHRGEIRARSPEMIDALARLKR
jgi:DNA-binding MarR family transcriptional regulator